MPIHDAAADDLLRRVLRPSAFGNPSSNPLSYRRRYCFCSAVGGLFHHPPMPLTTGCGRAGDEEAFPCKWPADSAGRPRFVVLQIGPRWSPKDGHRPHFRRRMITAAPAMAETPSETSLGAGRMTAAAAARRGRRRQGCWSALHLFPFDRLVEASLWEGLEAADAQTSSKVVPEMDAYS